MTFKNIPAANKYILTGSIGDIIINHTTDIIVKVRILAGTTSTIILEEKFTPDAKGDVYIRDLGKVIEAHLSPTGSAATLYSHANLTAYISLNVQPVGSIITYPNYFYAVKGIGIKYNNTSSDQFFNESFLTLLKDEKKTTEKSIEYISWLSSTIAGQFSLEYMLLTGEVITLPLHSFDAWQGKRDVITYQLSLEGLGIDSTQVIRYKFIHDAAGVRKEFLFNVDHQVYDTKHNFGFENRFGVPENCTFFGKETIGNNLDNMQNVITTRGKRRIGYSENNFALNTGIQPSNQQAYWLYGFFESETTWISDKYENIQIVIEDSTLEYNPNDATSRNFSFTYSYAQESKNAMLTIQPKETNGDNILIDDLGNIIVDDLTNILI